jgi:hypothetical protein
MLKVTGLPLAAIPPEPRVLEARFVKRSRLAVIVISP